MDHEIFSNDNAIDIERRIRQLKSRIERLARGGQDTGDLLAELQLLQADPSRAA